MINLSPYLFECKCKTRSIPPGAVNLLVDMRLADEKELVKKLKAEDQLFIDNATKSLLEISEVTVSKTMLDIINTRKTIMMGRKEELKVATITSLSNEGVELNCPICSAILIHYHNTETEKQSCMFCKEATEK